MAKKMSLSEKRDLWTKIGRLRAERLLLGIKYLWALRSKDKLSELAKIHVARMRLEVEIADLRKKYDEMNKEGE